MMKQIALVWLVVASLSMVSAALDSSEYTNSIQFDPKYTMYWRVDKNQGDIFLGFEVECDGFFGFGIGEDTTGSMIGADIVTAQRNAADSTISIADRFAVKFEKPPKDPIQNWNLVSGVYNAGVMEVEISRKLLVDNYDDRNITEGYNRVIWSFGSLVGGDISYHGADRGIDSILFYGDPQVNEPQDVDHTEVVYMNGYTIPDVETTYACLSFNVSQDMDRHIVQMGIDIPAVSKPFVHHILLFLCEEDHHFRDHDTAKPCSDTIIGKCPMQLLAWAQGDQKFTLPENVGFEAGPSSFTAGVIQVHYDNRGLEAGVKDNTSVVIEMTSTKRQYDAGILAIGDPFVLQKDPIPAGLEFFHYEQTCPRECTKRFSQSINIFSVFLHMHELGNMMWDTVYPADGSQPFYTSRAEYYAFNRQNMNPTDFKLNPGDMIQTHCVFNSEARSTPAQYGAGSLDEMCMTFLYYWPRINSDDGDAWGYCGFGGDSYDANATLCTDNRFADGESIAFAGHQTKFGISESVRVYGLQPAPSTTEGVPTESSATTIVTYLLAAVTVAVAMFQL